MLTRDLFKDPRTRWWALGLMVAWAVVETGYQVWNIRKGPAPGQPPGDPAIYRSLEDNSSRHGRIARWAHQFMTLEEATEILTAEGYRCEWYEKRSGLKCTRDLWLPAIAHVEVKAENGFVRFARGYYESTRYRNAGRYFESAVAAPGFEFADAPALARYMAERLRLREPGKPAPDAPPRVGGFRQVTDFFRELGIKCSTEDPPGAETGLPEMHCATRSLAGQEQRLVLKLSEDGLPAELEGIIGGQRATVALAGQPLPNADGYDEVLVRETLQPARLMSIVDRPETRAFEDKFAATYAKLDDPSKRRVLRLIARQIDERFKADEDDALRPLLQQLDFGALFVRRMGELRGGREIALKSSPKTYAAFALAECDPLPAIEARTCFLEYSNVRPELQQMLEQAVSEVKAAHRVLDAAHPVAERLQRLQSFAK